MNAVVTYKPINMKHLGIGEDFVRRVIQALEEKTLNISGYSVRDYNSSSEERIELNLGNNQSLVLTFSTSKY